MKKNNLYTFFTDWLDQNKDGKFSQDDFEELIRGKKKSTRKRAIKIKEPVKKQVTGSPVKVAGDWLKRAAEGRVR